MLENQFGYVTMSLREYKIQVNEVMMTYRNANREYEVKRID